MTKRLESLAKVIGDATLVGQMTRSDIFMLNPVQDLQGSAGIVKDLRNAFGV